MNRHLLRSLFAAAGLALVALSPAAIADDKAATKQAEKAERVAELKLGDKAPALQVESFIKGDAISEFKAGHVYVVEFWATWCGPCIRAFPHLSELQKEHAGKVTFVGVNIWQDARPGMKYDEKTLPMVTTFVEGQAEKMAYTVAYDGPSKKMDKAYMKAAKQNGIPAAFIVDGNGLIAWIGFPPEMDEPLAKIVAGTWDIEAAKQAAIDEAKAGKEVEAVMEAIQASDFEKAVTLAKKIGEGKSSRASSLAIGAFTMQIKELKQYDAAYAYAKGLVDGKLKDDAQALNAIAWTIVDPEEKLEKQDLALALAAAERANTLTKDKDEQVIDTLARVHFAKGDKAKAIELQTKAVSLASDDRTKAALQASLDEYNKAK